jgi:hypothetical protein
MSIVHKNPQVGVEVGPACLLNGLRMAKTMAQNFISGLLDNDLKKG